MATTPGELDLLYAAAAALQAATGANYWFEADANGAFVVSVPELKHLAEFDHAYFVHPGDVIYQVDTGCRFLVTGDFLVTVAHRVGDPELPWQAGHVPIPEYQLKMAQDVTKALNTVELVAASGSRTAIAPQIASRNLAIEADGWAMVQVQLSFTFTEVIG